MLQGREEKSRAFWRPRSLALRMESIRRPFTRSATAASMRSSIAASACRRASAAALATCGQHTTMVSCPPG